MKKTLLALSALPLLAVPVLAGDKEAKENKTKAQKCPICEKEANPKCTTEYEGKTYAFNSGGCRDKFKKQREESLYHQLGGKAAINAAVDLFYVKVLADDRINHFFEDVNMKRQHNKQKQFLSAALGGPEAWTGKDMRKAHKDLPDLDEDHFNAVAEHLQSTLAELKVEKEMIGKVMAAVGSVKGDVLNEKKSDKPDAKKKKNKKKEAKKEEK